ncbi:hypothetical protein CJ191_06395 [Aerococcus viridans]|uniref:phosphoserine phosphatase n=1 Tax=Aerococcus viridans TaxID=1377 RepID=A0A2N6UD24_9LACT|nr:haloacid dehalogenase-like hydrolase [Aerococcus viridans]PMC79472.1 hypothetical protein CJ191_06395 [Aerococcus viridans]
MPLNINQQKWDPFVVQRLNTVIQESASDLGTDKADTEYAVFDFDNTTIMHDIEDHLMMYMIDHLAYKMTPDEFYEVLTNGPMNFNQPIFSNSQNKATYLDLANDIIAQYQVLYTDYISLDENERLPLEQVKEWTQFDEFATKLRLFYQKVGSEFQRTPGKNSPIYWFKGYTVNEFKDVSIAVFEDALAKPIALRRLSSSPHIQSKVGEVEATIQQGIRIADEILNLWQALKDNNITIYIITASPIDLVRSIVTKPPFNLDASQVFGQCYDVDQEGVIDSRLEAGTYITKGLGKVEVIKNFMVETHGKEPAMVFGDSMGDYPMMTQLPSVKLSVLFNRYASDRTQQLVAKGINMYNQKNANLVVQGRDENKGTLRPNMATIPLGQLEPVLQVVE